MRIFIAAALAVALMGGAVSAAAEGALPGDMLYPVKVGVNENAYSVLAFSSEAKVDWELERVDRRLKEMERLALDGRLDDSRKSRTESRLEDHVDSILSLVGKFENGGDEEAVTEVLSELEAVLRAHGGVFSSLEIASEGMEIEIEDLRGRTKERLARTSGEKIEERANEAHDDANAAIAKAEEYINFKSHGVGENTLAAAQARLSAARQYIEEGNLEFADEDFGRAFSFFKESAVFAKEAKHLVDTSSKVGVEIEKSVSLKTVTEAMVREDRTKIRTTLAGDTINNMVPSGYAKFEERDDRQKLTVEVQDVNLPDGTSLDIYVNNAKVGTVQLQNRIAELELDSRNIQDFPQIRGNERIEAKKSDGGVVLAGTLPAMPSGSSIKKETKERKENNLIASPSPRITPSHSPLPSPDVDRQRGRGSGSQPTPVVQVSREDDSRSESSGRGSSSDDSGRSEDESHKSATKEETSNSGSNSGTGSGSNSGSSSGTDSNDNFGSGSSNSGSGTSGSGSASPSADIGGSSSGSSSLSSVNSDSASSNTSGSNSGSSNSDSSGASASGSNSGSSSDSGGSSGGSGSNSGSSGSGSGGSSSGSSGNNSGSSGKSGSGKD
ncbi:MAG: hypothetical protein HYV77_04430 [Candidatus Wildermuthbacteria bacterium]|nr:hypothetical protein [Candidatus Wildermuthbacteria bacterium]